MPEDVDIGLFAGWCSRGVEEKSADGRLVYRVDGASVYFGDALELYDKWPPPVVIVSDGAYGLDSFPGDPKSAAELPEWYLPHLAKWSEHALPCTTLWFWNSELGWATMHPYIEKFGWEYRGCHIWDKGIGHVAGNSNTRTLRKFPVVTEVCVQYVKRVYFESGGARLTMQEWLRHEWLRSGLPLYKANAACGVRNAATRKYLTADHLWYFPPPEHFEMLVQYANRYGDPDGRPYFSVDGRRPLTAAEWRNMRAKFYCRPGVTNVWHEPPVRGNERRKVRFKCVHMNQKPVRLLELILETSSDPGDVIWEPFGGLCSVAAAALRSGRRCFSAERVRRFYEEAKIRLEAEHGLGTQVV